MAERPEPPIRRDLRGYGEHRPNPLWPQNARIAVQFVLNYEEGGENSVLYGDGGAETFLADMVPAPEVGGMRHMTVESVYEYGSRAGVWRILRLFEEKGWPLTIFAVASALDQLILEARDLADPLLHVALEYRRDGLGGVVAPGRRLEHFGARDRHAALPEWLYSMS